MGATIELAASDGHKLTAYVTEPAGKVRGGMLVCHDIWGKSDYIRDACKLYAAEGYASIAPWLYDREKRGIAYGYDAFDAARSQRRRLIWSDVVKDLGAAVEHVARYGSVGAVGYCLGGSLAWLAASHLKVAAVSSYYGLDIAGWLGEHRPKCPTILHFGDIDEVIPLPDVEKIKAVYPEMPVYIYNADHAFDNARGSTYAPEAAKLARDRSFALFRLYVG
jgi:carboxymethylenebutenolidase